MIEKHYAAHIKNTLDAAAINVMRPKAAKAGEKMAKAGDGGNGKGKASGKFKRVRQTVSEEQSREAGLRVTGADLAPGALTAENNG